MAEPTFKQKIATLILGLMLPLGCLYAHYLFYVQAVYLPFLQLRNGIESEFYVQFKHHKIGEDYPPIDVVITGDSTTKFGIDPEMLRPAFTVNLALMGGTALKSYQTLTTYLETRPAPKCVVYAVQSQWENNYRDFLSKELFSGEFGVKEAARIWQIGAENNVYPATSFSAIHYFWHVLTRATRLHGMPISEFRDWVFNRLYRSDIKTVSALLPQLLAHRGYWPKTYVVNEDKFFSLDLPQYRTYLGQFEPSPTETFYLKKLMELAKQKGFKILATQLPVAESQWVASSRNFREASRANLRATLNDPSIVTFVDLPPVLPRIYYINFTHPNQKGAELISSILRPTLERECRPQK